VALREIQQAGPKRKLVGLELEGKRIARQGTLVKKDEATVGEVTSGTFSPTLQNRLPWRISMRMMHPKATS